MRWAAAAATLALCAACASGAEPAESTASPAAGVPPSTVAPSSVVAPSSGVDDAPPVPGLRAEAVQLRTDAAVGGRIQVRITASETFTVTGVALDSPGFERLPEREVSTDFEPGRVIDLPVAYGLPRCAARPEPAVALLTLTRPGGVAERVRAPLAAEVLGRIHDDECAMLALGEKVAIEVRALRADGDALTGELVLTRRSGDDEVRAVRVLRSVLVAVTAELPASLADDAVSTPISFTPATCEPHVLAETKQPFVFPLTVEIGAEEPVTMDLPLTPSVREQLADLVDRVCA
jgi:hypothetical protein